MIKRRYTAALLCLTSAGSGCGQLSSASVQGPASVHNTDGLQLFIATENTQPTLRVVLPGHATSDRSIGVVVPEHVTAVRQGSTIAEQLCLFRPGAHGEPPKWGQAGRSLEYQRDLPGGIHLLARATLEDDGVRFRYEFTNRSDVAYGMIYAVTDPRLTGMSHDVRLERTYVHHTNGFDLLASETPGRLTMPLNQWLPARHLASFTWPVPAQRLEKRDGITHYNKSRAVDLPFIATLSVDKAWVVASFDALEELEKEHADPVAGGSQAIASGMLDFLDEVFGAQLREVVAERGEPAVLGRQIEGGGGHHVQVLCGERIAVRTMGEADEGVHQRELTRVIALEAGDAFPLGHACRFGQLPELTAIDERFEDVLRHGEVAVSDSRHGVAQPRQRGDGFPDAEVGDVIGNCFGAECEAIPDVLRDRSIAAVAANNGIREIEVLDHRFELAAVAFGDLPAKDHGACGRLSDRAILVEQARRAHRGQRGGGR